MDEHMNTDSDSFRLSQPFTWKIGSAHMTQHRTNPVEPAQISRWTGMNEASSRSLVVWG